MAYLSKRDEKPTRKKKNGFRLPVGFYVYGWCEPGKSIPFYIGKGSGNRAWTAHKRKDWEYQNGGIAWCERSAPCSEAKVVIYKEGLTEEEAFLVESVLKNVLEGMGVALKNQR